MRCAISREACELLKDYFHYGIPSWILVRGNRGQRIVLKDIRKLMMQLVMYIILTYIRGLM